MKTKIISKAIIVVLTVLFSGMAGAQAQSMRQMIYGNAQPKSGLVGNNTSGSTNTATSSDAGNGQSGFAPYQSMGSEPLLTQDNDLFAVLCELNQDAYHPDLFNKPPIGWGVKPLKNGPNITATLLTNSALKMAVIVFRGTEVKDLFQRDVKTDLAAFFIGMPTKNFDEAKDAVKLAQSTCPNLKLIVTGHSLGGSEAAYAAAVVEPNVKAVVFSSPGIPTGLYEDRMLDKSKKWIQANVLNVYLTGDKISELGMNPESYTNRLVSRAHGNTTSAEDKMQPEGRCPAYYFPRSYPLQNGIPDGLGPFGFANKHNDSPETIIKLISSDQRQQIDSFLESPATSIQGGDL
jgi:hypothetical protein